MSEPRPLRGLQLDRVVLLGRTFAEYCGYFLLKSEEWRGKRVLDVAGGVSSFTAEANEAGIHATSVDPIYSMSGDEIARPVIAAAGQIDDGEAPGALRLAFSMHPPQRLEAAIAGLGEAIRSLTAR